MDLLYLALGAGFLRPALAAVRVSLVERLPGRCLG